MNSRLFKVAKKTVKIIVITIVSVVLILFLLPYILPGTISKKIKTFVNRSIDGKIEFSKARLSFFNHFPSLALTLYDFSSTGSAPFQNEKLLSADEVSMGIRIGALLKGEIHIDEFYLSGADINVQVNEKGRVTRATAVAAADDGLHRYLAEQAQKSAWQWRFNPARAKGGARVAANKTIHFVFTP